MSLVFTLALLGVMAWVALNRQNIIDQWHIQTFKPTAAALQLATDDMMAGRGKDLFLASQAEIDAQSSFNHNCTVGSEKTIVLGCYAAQRIYIYSVTDPKLSGIEEVTAAHEMLHAAYERLDTTTKTHVDDLLNAELQKLNGDSHLTDLIKLYNDSEPGELLNEMHSVLGTEYGNLSPELETYYKQYFSDRSKIVAYSDAYEAVFTASQKQLADMDANLSSIKSQIDASDAALGKQQVDLQAALAQLNQLAAQGDPAAYNQQVSLYNQKVTAYNTLIQRTKDLINRYNALVETRNQQAAAQNNLYQSIDSRYQPEQQH
ncbi:MAG TPA: hypothetical protein VNG90_05100 [Candidatus Acidoferrum sp.]|nr:hypothetical protein [Candidatus Acidoferrum sp.]